MKTWIIWIFGKKNHPLRIPYDDLKAAGKIPFGAFLFIH